MLLLVLLIALGQTSVSTALPVIAAEFDAASQVDWVVSAYFLVRYMPKPVYPRNDSHLDTSRLCIDDWATSYYRSREMGLSWRHLHFRSRLSNLRCRLEHYLPHFRSCGRWCWCNWDYGLRFCHPL